MNSDKRYRILKRKEEYLQAHHSIRFHFLIVAICICKMAPAISINSSFLIPCFTIPFQ